MAEGLQHQLHRCATVDDQAVGLYETNHMEISSPASSPERDASHKASLLLFRTHLKHGQRTAMAYLPDNSPGIQRSLKATYSF